MRYVQCAWVNRIGRLLAILMLAMVSALLLAAPVRADGDTVALSITNGTTFTYGGTQPMFTAVVTFGTKPTANYYWSVNVKLDDGENFNSTGAISFSQDGMTLTFSRITPPTPIAAGQHTAIVSFSDQGTGTTVYSSPLSFTVNQASIPIACGFKETLATVYFLGLNQTLHVQMTPFSGSGQLPAAWQSDTYTVTFDGPTHVTFSNLVSDSNGIVAVTSPAQLGLYSLTCAFSGDANYTPETFTNPQQYTVSAQHALGSMELFTTPTKLTPQQYYDFYLVLHAAPGVPTPTGYFQIWMGNWYTHTIPLTSSGDCLLRFLTPPDLSGVTKITIQYWGDTYYDVSAVDFPLTNPPVPGDTNTGSPTTVSTTNNPQGTATAQGTPATTATADNDTATPTAVGTGNVALTTHTSSSDTGGLWLIVILAMVGLIVLGGAVGAAIFLMRRARMSAALGPQAPRDFYVPPSYAPPSEGTWPPLRED